MAGRTTTRGRIGAKMFFWILLMILFVAFIGLGFGFFYKNFPQYFAAPENVVVHQNVTQNVEQTVTNEAGTNVWTVILTLIIVGGVCFVAFIFLYKKGKLGINSTSREITKRRCEDILSDTGGNIDLSKCTYCFGIRYSEGGEKNYERDTHFWVKNNNFLSSNESWDTVPDSQWIGVDIMVSDKEHYAVVEGINKSKYENIVLYERKMGRLSVPLSPVKIGQESVQATADEIKNLVKNKVIEDNLLSLPGGDYD